MKRLLIVGLLLVAVQAHAAISQKQTFSCYASTASQLNCPMTAVAIAQDDFVVVIGSTNGTNYNLTTANCGGLVLSRMTNTNAGRTGDVWIGGPATTAASACVVTPARASGNDTNNTWVGLTYSGVSGVNAWGGQSPSGAPPASPYMCAPGPATAGLSPIAAGNMLVAFFKQIGVVAVGWTASFAGLGVGSGTTSSTIVQAFVPSTPVVSASNMGANGGVLYVFQAPVISAMVGARATPYATLTYSIPSGTISNCAWGLIELKQTPPSGTVTTQSAKLSDATRTILLQNATGVHYVLPNQLLAANWCTWLLPTVTTSGLNTVSPQGPNLINGQGAAIDLKPWQMTKVCQDSDGNYWTNPPIVGDGSTITVTPSPTAITIATAGTRARVPVIAHGRVEIGGHLVPAGRCSLPVGAHAERVTVSDIIEHSAPDLGMYLEVWAFPGHERVEFEICNSSSHALTPHRTVLTWRVSR